MDGGQRRRGNDTPTAYTTHTTRHTRSTPLRLRSSSRLRPARSRCWTMGAWMTLVVVLDWLFVFGCLKLEGNTTSLLYVCTGAARVAAAFA